MYYGPHLQKHRDNYYQTNCAVVRYDNKDNFKKYVKSVSAVYKSTCQ